MVLAIDLGGVLIHDPLHELLDALEKSGGLPQREMQQIYVDQFRYPLWSGTLEEEEFWTEMLRVSGASGSVEEWREFLLESLRLLPAAERIEELSSQAQLFSISNHRSEWILPVLRDNGLDDYFEEIFISSEVGEVKPDAEFFELFLSRSGASLEEVLFIDNLQRNLDAAKELGMNTLLADTGGDWVDTLVR